jgi:hypothetical protein
MPDVHAVATFVVPKGMEKITRLAFIIARSANVLSLIDDQLVPYRDDVRSRTQRLCRALEALDVETLWSSALASACGMVIQPTVQQALRSSHARSLAALESSLRATTMPDLSSSFAVQYTGLYEDVLQNLVRGLRESVTSSNKPMDRVTLRRCYQRHVQILLEHSTVARVVDQPLGESGFTLQLESGLSRPSVPTAVA